jgi:hypothetical protein
MAASKACYPIVNNSRIPSGKQRGNNKWKMRGKNKWKMSEKNK